MTTTLLEIAGLGLISLAGFLVYVPLGFLTLGLSLLALGYLLED